MMTQYSILDMSGVKLGDIIMEVKDYIVLIFCARFAPLQASGIN